MSPIWIAVAAPLFLALVLIAFALTGFRRRRPLAATLQLLVAFLLVAVGGLVGVVAVGMGSYAALTREQTAALVEVSELAPQRYQASFTMPGGTTERFELGGDEIYVDARIIKWHPRANLIGLHTAYQLDRVAGRYRSLDDEQTRPRSVYQLADPGPIDLFTLIQRYPALGPLVDAEYGSGTFAPLEDGVRYEVLVSTSGLLIRRR